MTDPGNKRSRRRLVMMVVLILSLLALAAAWRWTALNEFLAPENFQRLMAGFDHPITRAAAATGVMMIALTMMVPLTLLAVFAGIAFGGGLAFVYTFLAALVSAALVFTFGRLLGNRALEKVGGDRVNRISRQLSDYGVATVAIARVVPMAPFTVFNLVAGASHLGFRAFLLGSMIALGPGIAALTLLSDSVKAAFEDPSTESVIIMLVFALVILSAIVVMRRRFTNK